jgi:glycosyltransferase involved in cell wall biosynthesis
VPKHKIVMIVPQPDVQGGIAAVVNGYRGSRLERDYDIRYVESYCDGSKWDKFLKAVRAYRTFRRMLREDAPELVHIHSSFGPSFWRKLPFIRMCSARGIPVVNHIHGSEFGRFYADAGALKRRAVRKAYAQCAAIIVLNETAADNIATIVPRSRISVIMNYAVCRREMADPAVQQRRAEKKQVLILGKIDRMKGSYDLPAVVSKVRHSVPQARFVAAGYGEIEEVKACFDRETLAGVDFPGWIRGADKDRALRESAVFFLPSYSEGMPMSVLEAMGSALPVVSTNVGGIPRLVTDGVSGRLLAPGDTDGMASAVTEYLTDEAAREKAGLAGLAAAGAFGLDAHLDKIEKVWEAVLGGSGRERKN